MMQIIPFTKMHGCGNDYICVNAMQHPIAHPQACAVAWSDRHKGIGSDGLVLIDRSPVPEADFAMRIFNADGSEAMMCGNACRCIGKYLYEKTHPWPLQTHPQPLPCREGSDYQEAEIRLLTLSGIKTLYLHIYNNKVESVTVDMGEPILEDGALYNPNLAEGQYSLDEKSAEGLSTPRPTREGQGEGLKGLLVDGTFVSMGNPHFVIFTDDVDQVVEKGRILEHHPAFPQRCNIEFAQVLSDGTIRTRVWERGSGITMACGTGACATAVAACLQGHAGRESDIVMDGGTLHVEWRESDHHVYMTGPAAFVFDGEVEMPI